MAKQMNRKEYLSHIESTLKKLLTESRFENNKRQLFATQLNADFNATYSEDYFWDHAIQISTCAGLSQKMAGDQDLVITAFKSAAEAFEILGNITSKFDKNFCLILSALCYDLAGYQANAYCLLRNFPSYNLQAPENSDLDLERDNYIYSQVIRILSKQIPYSNQQLRTEVKGSIGLFLFNEFLSKWFRNILNGEDNEYIALIDKAYLYFLREGNIYISQIIFLLRERIRSYENRSLWDQLLYGAKRENTDQWHKYVKLLTNDFYDKNRIKNIHERHSKFEFWTSQLRAIEGGILDDSSNFVIQMPTSAGKTFIAELAILDHLTKYPGKRCIYIAPFRTLTSEKENDFSESLSKLGYSVSALSGSYEVDEFEEVILEETDVLISTPEKIDALLRINPEYFSSISLLVVDEGHIIGDISARSSLLEFLIIRLRMKIKDLRTIFISAVMPPENANEYSIWLNERADKVLRSKLFNGRKEDDWEPTRKLIGRFDWISDSNGTITYQNLSTIERGREKPAFVPFFLIKTQYKKFKLNKKARTTAALAFKFAASGNTFVYISQVRLIKTVSESLIRIIKLNKALKNDTSFFKEGESQSLYFARKWFGEDSYVTEALSMGIGIHYGDMPEAVRKAVEMDYLNGNLTVLLATNTIGQGVNLPIKNIIIHSTILNADEYGTEYISVRDFWNLIGRAGRAGKETEGQIIFVVNSFTDDQQYTRLTDKENLEEAKSIIFQMLDALASKRINPSTFLKNMNILSESYLLSLLSEELNEDEIQNTVESVISNSLFNIQAIKRDINVDVIRKYFNSTFSKLKEELTQSEINVFASTGLSRSSNIAFLEVIDANLGILNADILFEEYENILKLIFEVFDQNPDEFYSYKLDNLKIKPSQLIPLAHKWILGYEIDELRDIWEEICDNDDGLFIVISDCFFYRYCWGVTSFLTLLCYRLEIEINDLPEPIKHLASFIKYGINTPTACLARSIGIRNRNVAELLSARSGELKGKSFLKWLANIELDNIEDWLPTIYDCLNVREVVNKLTPERQQNLDSFEFEIAGITQNDLRRELSKTIDIGYFLTYERELDNLYDPMAIKIMVDDEQVGYVPRQIAKILSVEIDLNDIEYDIQVIDWIDMDDYDRIFVKMFKTEN